MPNHIHAIILLTNDKENKQNLPYIIGRFKSFSANQLIKLGLKNFRWQKDFYDTIIRNKEHYMEIQKYIYNNPIKWELDKFYCKESRHRGRLYGLDSQLKQN